MYGFVRTLELICAQVDKTNVGAGRVGRYLLFNYISASHAFGNFRKSWSLSPT